MFGIIFLLWSTCYRNMNTTSDRANDAEMRENKLFWCLNPHFFTEAIHIGIHRQRWTEWREYIHFYSFHIHTKLTALDLANKIASSRIEGWKAHSKFFQFLVEWRWLSQAYANRPLISTSWNKLQWKHFYCHSLPLWSIQSTQALPFSTSLWVRVRSLDIKGGKILHKIFSIRLSTLNVWWFNKNPWSIASKWRAKPCGDKNR